MARSKIYLCSYSCIFAAILSLAFAGEYCMKVAREAETKFDNKAIRKFKKTDEPEATKDKFVQRVCGVGKKFGMWGPGAGYCDKDYTKANADGKMKTGEGRSKQGVSPQQAKEEAEKQSACPAAPCYPVCMLKATPTLGADGPDSKQEEEEEEEEDEEEARSLDR